MGEDDKNQKDTKSAIDRALRSSRTSDDDEWGPGVPISRSRPESILNHSPELLALSRFLAGNAFCATGPGGGIDPSCSAGDGAGTEKPGFHSTLAAAKAWGEQRGIKVVEGASGTKVSRDQLNTVNQQVAKMPEKALKAAQDLGSRIDVVGGSGITDHPSNAHFKGVTPRGWEGTGKTWDDVPGGSATKAGGSTIISARAMLDPTAHGSANLILHEHAHTMDLALGRQGGSRRLVSHEDDWKTIHAREKWGSEYETRHPEEAWAESFAKMYHSTTTRKDVPAPARDYFLKRFGPGQPHVASADMTGNLARMILAPVFDDQGLPAGDIPLREGEIRPSY